METFNEPLSLFKIKLFDNRNISILVIEATYVVELEAIIMGQTGSDSSTI